jgi:hypothetical protein
LLPSAAQAAFNSYDTWHDPLCLPNTRVDVLEQIIAWADRRDEKCIFWLNGMAGTGKSTIARTVARKYHDKNRLGASFFFSKGRGDVNHARKLFTSIAAQLASKSPSLKRYICEAIAEHRGIASQTLGDQWNQLLLRPLSKLEADSIQSPLILVIDALDECESENDIRGILRLLTTTKDLDTVQLRVFITSRPETPIRFGFRAIPGDICQGFVLHDISQSVVEHDISIFIKHKLKEIQERRFLSAEWPDEQNIELLVQRAGSLFIYAATVCRFIAGSKFPKKRLELVTLGSTAEQVYKPSKLPTVMLDEMYTNVLRHSALEDCDEDKSELNELFRRIVGCIVILSDSLSAAALAELLSVEPEMVNLILGSLHSVLDVPEHHDSPIRLLHPSFRDFLLDEQRCLDDQFRVNEKRAHRDLVDSCLKVMSNALKRDMCGLQMPGVLTSEVESNTVSHCLPGHVQYACRYWVDHLQRGKIGLCGDNEQVHKFLKEHFLHWLEALSLIGKMPEGVFMIEALQSMLTVSDLVLSPYDLRC